VQYTNAANVSPMSKLRQENGQAAPWKVKYWGMGNEAWGCGGNMRAEYYADLYRQYATYFTAAAKGSEVYRIAAGSYSNNTEWTEVLMKNIPHKLMEGISLHHYSVIDWAEKGPSTEFTEAIYFKTMEKALAMEAHIQAHSTIMDKYDPAKKIGLIVDEWGGWYEVEPGTNGGFLYQQNTMRDAMIAGTTLNTFNNHCDRVKMANLAQTINVLQAVILTEKEKMLLTPTYHVLEMYKVHQDAMMIPVHVKTVDYTVADKELPAISAAASVDEAGKIHISLVNIHAKEAQEVSIALRGAEVKTVTGRILKSGKLQNHNTFDNPNAIVPQKFEAFEIEKGTLIVKLPAFSVVVLEVID